MSNEGRTCSVICGIPPSMFFGLGRLGFRGVFGFLDFGGLFGSPIVIPAKTIKKFFVELTAIDLFD